MKWKRPRSKAITPASAVNSGSAKNNARKRRSVRIADIEERKTKTFVLECPVINLDMEESVAEMPEATEGDSEGIQDIELVGRAMRELTEGARVEQEVLIPRLQRILNAAKLELKEVEES